jgi:alpha-ketoglutarate-dependent taurine dioxygenase
MPNTFAVVVNATGVEARRLTAVLGAVVEGIRLENITDHEFKALNDSLLDHQVLFLRGQHISEVGQCALASQFGTP